MKTTRTKKSAPAKLSVGDVIEIGPSHTAATYTQRTREVESVRGWEVGGITAGVGYVKGKPCSVRVDRCEHGIEREEISLGASARLLR